MTEFLGKTLKTPLIVSSCPLTEKAESVLRLADAGVGGAILKSCAEYVRGRYVGKRRFYAVDNGYFASSPYECEILTLDEEISLLKELRAKTDIPLLASFTAQTLSPDNWKEPCEKLIKAGADAVQLDFFYMVYLMGSNDFWEQFTHLLKQLNKLSAPVIPKLNINFPMLAVMPYLKDAGTEYVSLLDSVRVPPMRSENGSYPNDIDPETCSFFGGWMLPLTISFTHLARKSGLKPISGGGITSSKDIKWLFDAGAEFVQSASFLMKNGAGNALTF